MLNWDAIDWNALVALVAVGISAYALLQTHRHKSIERRPWLNLTQVVHRKEQNGTRLLAILTHVSGGAALKLRFRIGINDKTSKESVDTPALVPGDSLKLESALVKGGDIGADDRIRWIFSFEDEAGVPYSIEIVHLLNSKQLDYIPKKLTWFRRLLPK